MEALPCTFKKRGIYMYMCAYKGFMYLLLCNLGLFTESSVPQCLAPALGGAPTLCSLLCPSDLDGARLIVKWINKKLNG